MSIESASAYLNKLNNDVNFQEKVKAAKDKDARIQLIKSAGFDFTEEHFAKAKSQMPISDDNMNQIAGGCLDYGCGCDFRF